MTRLLVFVGLLLSVSHASAEMIDHGTYTTDTDAGLDWLDWSETAGLTPPEVELSEWRYATVSEFQEFLEKFHFERIGGLVNEEDRALAATVFDLMGTPEEEAVVLIIDGPRAHIQMFSLGQIDPLLGHAHTGWSVTSVHSDWVQGDRFGGHALVREAVSAPEPSTFLAGLAGIAGLVFFTRRRLLI